MYLSKLWRDARMSIAIFAIPFVFEMYGLLRHPGGGVMTGSHESIEYLLTRFISIAGILLLFVGWSLAGNGIGLMIAEDQGAYILTRPRSRKFFLWFDSGFSFGLMAALAWATVLLFALVTRLHMIRLPDGAKLSAGVILLIPLCGLVFAGLVYALSYLCTVLLPRHNTARVVSVSLLIGYMYLHFRSRHWSGITHNLFPSWWVDPFPDRLSSAATPHVWLELGVRVLVILVLLLAAQFVLERREIRA